MEGSNSEAIFESLNLSPQLFINEVLNIVDDLLDEAFNFFLQEGSTLLKVEGTDRSADLSKGVAYIRNLVQLALDQRMQKWEEYCLRFCFRVPEGFALPKANEMSGDDLPDIDALTDTELDTELNSLRDKLTAIGKESAELDRELRALERQSSLSNQSAGSIDEALQLYKENDVHQMFQELTTVASEFRVKLENLKRKKIEEIQCDRTDRLRVRHGDLLNMPHGNGPFGAKLEELQEFLDEIMR
ncbi:protein MIS12 homolog [Sesamum indicum]|uniref:Protein MIS12 homolog n=1 Tax=Sesamum indicum TaxID=4182 RepID=A0A6I9UB75_SESIN|nr:protein MIS12 homolog [Sesamum indicum]